MKKQINVGDIVRHYSCGNRLELGVVINVFDYDCRIWYPTIGLYNTTLISDLNVISTWKNLEIKVQGDLRYTDDLLNNNILK